MAKYNDHIQMFQNAAGRQFIALIKLLNFSLPFSFKTILNEMEPDTCAVIDMAIKDKSVKLIIYLKILNDSTKRIDM